MLQKHPWVHREHIVSVWKGSHRVCSSLGLDLTQSMLFGKLKKESLLGKSLNLLALPTKLASQPLKPWPQHSFVAFQMTKQQEFCPWLAGPLFCLSVVSKKLAAIGNLDTNPLATSQPWVCRFNLEQSTCEQNVALPCLLWGRASQQVNKQASGRKTPTIPMSCNLKMVCFTSTSSISWELLCRSRGENTTVQRIAEQGRRRQQSCLPCTAR